MMWIFFILIAIYFFKEELVDYLKIKIKELLETNNSIERNDPDIIEDVDGKEHKNPYEKKREIDPNKIEVSFRGEWYDITKFINRHPGGKDLLIENNGKDIEKLMEEYTHSDRAYIILKKFLIKE